MALILAQVHADSHSFLHFNCLETFYILICFFQKDHFDACLPIVSHTNMFISLLLLFKPTSLLLFKIISNLKSELPSQSHCFSRGLCPLPSFEILRNNVTMITPLMKQIKGTVARWVHKSQQIPKLVDGKWKRHKFYMRRYKGMWCF